jgi:hypothetical protein
MIKYCVVVFDKNPMEVTKYRHITVCLVCSKKFDKKKCLGVYPTPWDGIHLGAYVCSKKCADMYVLSVI